MCKPKAHGGVGVTNLEKLGISPLSKWLWKFLDGDTSSWNENS